jgi:hypothetical protein
MVSFRRDSTRVFTIAPTHQNIGYTLYLRTLKDIQRIETKNCYLDKLDDEVLTYGIQTFYTPEDVRQDIENANLTVKLIETLRWLTSPEKRAGKQASIMIIAICGPAILKGLGDSVIVASTRCSVETSLAFGPSTRFYAKNRNKKL